MKRFNSSEMKKITKSTLALVLAGTFTFAPAMALADENEKDTETVDLQNVEGLNVNDSLPADLEAADDQEIKDDNAEKPTLIPGDFFYFAKISMEKIRLAFTFDETKEAKLLAEYASERLAEAGALFAEGKEEEALDVIEEAIQYIESTQEYIDEKTETDADNKEDQADSDLAPADETDTGSDESKADDQEGVEEVQKEVRNNIIALTAALGHVKNPKAKEALQKNIEKTFAKAVKKEEKQKEKAEKKATKKIGKTTEDKDQTIPALPDPVQDDAVNVEQPEAKKPEAPVQPQVTQPKQEQQMQRKEARQEIKVQRKEAKQQVKVQHQQAKQEVKAARQQAKQGTAKSNNGKGKN
ncbi:DUF5667 domain-containing protein [Mesobacillus zeae]|uniref:DUF5667 domain-containing protein n=1 Tax=Mesobacillus zeae TaxID=1917180 RepID=A0A398BCI2_9BACI|nr:DUF5667 domain-containing protein [Mesobacillus zeae]RID87785.1 hypothetical protein D1970_02770 [Mesobacillus zeae]